MSSTSSEEDNLHSSVVGSEAFDGVVPIYMKQMMEETQKQKAQSTFGKLPVY